MNLFAKLVNESIKSRGLSIRKVAREIDLDPSFFSKVLNSKRSPPADEKILKKLSKILGLDPLQIVMATGNIPSEFQAQLEKPEFFRRLRDISGPDGEIALSSAKDGRPAVKPSGGQARLKRISQDSFSRSSELSEDLL